MKKLLVTLVVGLGCLSAAAQQSVDSVDNRLAKYRRSSLYTVLMRHTDTEYDKSINSAFMAIPTPDKFNNHELEIKSFNVTDPPRQKKGDERDNYNITKIDDFISTNDIPRGMVAKWFNRDSLTGAFDMGLIQQRGSYDASQLDIRLADQSVLGRTVLADAGEELIGKTFLLVNDITFVDKGKKSATAGKWLNLASSILPVGQSLASATATLVNEIDGFSVNITSYLYRLDWSEEAAANFYTYCWMDASNIDTTRCDTFNTLPCFKLEYVGKTMTSAGNLSSKSFAKSKEVQMLRVCTRAIDKSIVQLQRDYDEFKVNVPLYKVNEDGTVDVQIGLKEGINEKSEFDVLMPVEDENGRTTYETVGRIQPAADKIWDNRFGADEDAAALAAEGSKDKAASDKSTSEDAPLGNVSLGASTFKVLSGANKIMPGCLVREVTIKRTN